MTKSISFKPNDMFSFQATVCGHGWYQLAPFELDLDKWRLGYVFADRKGNRSKGTIYERRGKIVVDLDSDKINQDEVTASVKHILRLDEDLAGFYDSVTGYERLVWVAERRAGRMLRSSTVFEDLVKTICTTNCSWGLTKIMVNNLVQKLGSSTNGGHRAFPTAAEMAAMPVDFYRQEIKAGYRSPYFVELANAVAHGDIDPELWLAKDLPTLELRKQIKSIKGVGDYAADNLLKLLGRYDGLALDSWLRSEYYKHHNKGKRCSDKKIERHYAKFGDWRGLAIWCDMTEDWMA